MSEIENLTEASDKTFEEEVVKADGPVVVDFWAPWCGPCQMFKPIFEKVAPEYKGKIKFVKLNVDDNPTSATAYQIMSIPTLAIFENGEIVERSTGFLDENDLKKKLDDYLAKK
jgi:thioredoxin 1